MAVQEKQRLTVRDLREIAQLPENVDKRLELRNGVIYELSPSFLPSIIAAAILQFLRSFVVGHDLGYVTGADGGYILSEDNVFIPDVAFISKTRLTELPEREVTGPPDLAVEVKSPTDTFKSLQTKAVEYLAFGTRMVWVVYPERKTVEVYTPVGEGNLNVETLDIDDTLDGGDVLPGFKLAVRDIFPR
jgi:Uma2 family endonuclease